MSSEITRLKDKVAVVTGAGQGIGRGIARRLAEEGAKVAVADINPDTAANTAAEITDAGRVACAITLDVTSLQDATAAAQAVERQLGPIDILVNNAGWDKVQHFLETDEELWDRLIDINFKGVLICVKAFAPRMLARPGSKIVSIASDAGRAGGVNDAVYSGCKGGVIAFTKTLARELARYQITVNAVAPGFHRYALVTRDFRQHSRLWRSAHAHCAFAAQGPARGYRGRGRVPGLERRRLRDRADNQR